MDLLSGIVNEYPMSDESRVVSSFGKTTMVSTLPIISQPG